MSDFERMVMLSKMESITEEYLDEQSFHKIGMVAKSGYDDDYESISEWRQEVEEIRKYLKNPDEEKTHPWTGASNVRYPLIMVSALQFSARAYPTILNDGNVALMKIVGEDPDGQKQARADRVGQYMSYQAMEEMSEWDADMDKLLLTVPFDGCAFKKVYYDAALRRNVSQFVMATDLVVNHSTVDLETCPRISHKLSLYPDEVKERVSKGIFRDEPYDIENESQDPVTFIEQHIRYDIDGDGYPEPWIVTFEEDTGNVARLRANFEETDIEADDDGKVLSIRKTEYFVKYECFPDPHGGFYGKGFGSMLLSLNASVDSILNQLIDAGHLSNTGGGFIGKGFRVKSGDLKFAPGEWKKVDTGGPSIRDSVMPIPIREPSNVLFSLLGLLVDAGKEIASIQDVITGGAPAGTPATSVLALIEQGMQVYNAIFKRVYRAMKRELSLLYRLNGKYLEDTKYQAVLDDPQANVALDFDMEDFDVRPGADPSLSTNVQKAARAEVLMQYTQFPGANIPAIMEESMRAAGISDPEKYMLPPQQGPSPEQLQELAELKIKREELELKRQKMIFESAEMLASTMENMAQTDEKGANNLLNMKELLILMKELIGNESATVQTAEPGVPQIPQSPDGARGGGLTQ